MGNSFSDTYVKVFANSSVWIEDAAIQQLHTTAANLDGIRAAVGLPDLHPGRPDRRPQDTTFRQSLRPFRLQTPKRPQWRLLHPPGPVHRN